LLNDIQYFDAVSQRIDYSAKSFRFHCSLPKVRCNLHVHAFSLCLICTPGWDDREPLEIIDFIVKLLFPVVQPDYQRIEMNVNLMYNFVVIE